MAGSRFLRRTTLLRLAVAVTAAALALTACTDKAPVAKHTKAPKPTVTAKDCGDFRIAYAPENGYEASAFIVGALAKEQLGCTVTYVKTTSRHAWRLVASGRADVYLDAFGNTDLRDRLAQPDGKITVLGPNGVRGGVDLLAPEFMGANGLLAARDLGDVEQIGWDLATAAITTVPELAALAESMVSSLNLSYLVKTDASAINGIGSLYARARADDANKTPAVYLVEGPREFLGTVPGRVSVDLPESSADDCVPSGATSLCSLEDFLYVKIANATFAKSGSPAAALVYNYRLNVEDAGNVLDIVALSAYDVHPEDVAAWLNTHKESWQAWLP